MNPSESANIPRWCGQHGYYEVWFLVVFEPETERAYWLRYSLFTPAPGIEGTSKAVVWTACFDAAATEAAFGFKNTYNLHELDRGLTAQFGIEIGPCRLGHGYAEGHAASEWHHLRWDLTFEPAAEVVSREPALAAMLAAATIVERANAEVLFNGRLVVDGVERVLENAPGIQYHIHGTARPESLRWLYCAKFDQHPNALLEAYSVVPSGRAMGVIAVPEVTPVYWRDAEVFDGTSATAALASSCERVGPHELRFISRSPLRTLTARAWADPAAFVGYVYRDPGGRDLYVAQSDIASCEVEFHHRRFPFGEWQRGERVTSHAGAALEIHGTDPVQGIAYIPWDADHLEDPVLKPVREEGGDSGHPQAGKPTYPGQRP